MNQKLELKTYSEETDKELTSEAMEFLGPQESTRRVKNFALAYYNDLPPVICGGGTRAIVWCESHKQMLEVIGNYLLPANANLGWDPVVDEAAKTIGDILQCLNRQEIHPEEAILRINDAARMIFQIEWWGTREELLSGNAKVPARIRGLFRRRHGSEDTAPIQPQELEKFLEYLGTEYGI